MQFLTKLAFLSLLFLRNTCAISLSKKLENNSKAIIEYRDLILGEEAIVNFRCSKDCVKCAPRLQMLQN